MLMIVQIWDAQNQEVTRRVRATSRRIASKVAEVFVSLRVTSRRSLFCLGCPVYPESGLSNSQPRTAPRLTRYQYAWLRLYRAVSFDAQCKWGNRHRQGRRRRFGRGPKPNDTTATLQRDRARRRSYRGQHGQANCSADQPRRAAFGTRLALFRTDVRFQAHISPAEFRP